ncbi:MAG TPA: TMEM143 family protein [Xanthobacteraceae bacterium]|jgi:hypothetical protein
MTAAGADERAATRERFIPVRKAELLDALIEHGALGSEAEREQFRQICRSLAAIFHYQYFEQLERLRHDYFYFDPEVEPHARLTDAALASAYDDLVESFETVLGDASFSEISHAEIDEAHQKRKTMRVKVAARLDDFRDIRFFHRGHHQEAVEVPTWLGLRRERHDVLVHDDVVLFVAARPAAAIASQRERKLLVRRRIRPGSVLIKYFRNVSSTDLKALFPNVRVVMSLFDTLALGIPALAGAIPILINLSSTLTVLFLVIGFYLGLVSAIEHDALKRAFAGMSGLAALIGFVMRQWLRYQRQSLKYQQELTNNVYFRNLNNNAGIFDYMIGEAEDQECKEAFLACYFLHTAATAQTQTELEGRIEAWLRLAFGVDITFKVADALLRLARLDVVACSGDRLTVPAPEEVLVRLRRTWAGLLAPEAGRPALAERA